MNRSEKAASIGELNKRFAAAESVVVAQYAGLSVRDMQDLRAKARAVGVDVKVAKNRLVNLAVAGTPYAGLASMLKGQNAFSFANDPVAAAKVMADYAKGNDKLVIVGGSMKENILDKKGVVALSQLPSLDELRSKIVGLLVAPATKIARVLTTPAGDLNRVIHAKSQKA
ncbi:MAG TPA: 50S ribosomal protein L10 [Alphaproteobacteria bacterium]|nr:50S ribosomal protein L10 [Alphaproteobacteria bacterium]